MRPYEEIACTSAPDFLEYLRVTGAQWGQAPACGWIFRGHGDASWPLLPSAWRSLDSPLLVRLARTVEEWVRGSRSHFAELLGYTVGPRISVTRDDYFDNVATMLIRTAAELSAVEHFASVADDVGLRLPGPHRSIIGEYIGRLQRLNTNDVLNGDSHWLLPEVDDIFGLAQHHGVPTRLLDFTRRSFVAAYFAAVSAKPGGDIAVWAVNTEGIMASRVRSITCRRYENSFLHAQDGLFLYDEEAPYDFVCTGHWPAIEEVLASPEHLNVEDGLRKVTLPAAEASHLLRLLWRERVSLPHLKPTYDNIASALPLYWELLDSV